MIFFYGWRYAFGFSSLSFDTLFVSYKIGDFLVDLLKSYTQ